MSPMSPEQRERFEKNLKRWRELPPEVRAELRKNSDFRRNQMHREIDDAVAKTGLELSPERKKLFAEKFTNERRAIEEELRKERDRKRSEAIGKLIENLREEFKAMPPEESAKPSPAKKPAEASERSKEEKPADTPKGQALPKEPSTASKSDPTSDPKTDPKTDPETASDKQADKQTAPEEKKGG